MAPIHTGEAAITPAFRLPAKYVIHAAGPVYDGHHPKECEDLAGEGRICAFAQPEI